jgi:predicted O-methyltransferase YrrM
VRQPTSRQSTAKRQLALPVPAPPDPGRRVRLALWLARKIADGYYIRLAHPPTAENAPRWGYGRPAHAALAARLARAEPTYTQQLHLVMKYEAELAAIPRAPVHPLEPHWDNGFLFGLDGAALYAFLRDRKPRTYVEVGSGNSTLFAARAIRVAGQETAIVSIDPQPRREIAAVCSTVIAEPLECIDLSVFRALEAGDIVFIDGTHRSYMNSDATVFFLEVLPMLSPGVVVGVHDVHLPDDYRPEYADRYYSEQYLLAAYLLAHASPVEPLLPCWYVAHQPHLNQIIEPLFDRPPMRGFDPTGVTFWATIASGSGGAAAAQLNDRGSAVPRRA